MLTRLLLLSLLLGVGPVQAQVASSPTTASLDDLKIVFFGSSVPYGQGATNKYGYPSRYGTLLARRAAAGQGAPWTTANISVGGNSTVQVLGRWDRDLVPQRARYVVYALALGNEGIHTGGQPVFDQFKANMLKLIVMARAQGMVPVVTNTYTRNDYTPTDYAFIKQMNLLLHAWAVPTVNLLGAIDDGHGRWAPGYWDDALHPNDLGHAELAHAWVPSLFDALRAGKVVPKKQPTSYVTFGKSRRTPAAAIRFVPEALVHPFTQVISFRAAAPGQLLALQDSTTSGYLRIERHGGLTYASAKGGRLTSAKSVLDNHWHHVVLTHYYARGETLLYLDSTLVGSLPEKLLAKHFTIGGARAPARVQLRNWLFYRAGMNPEEVQALAADSLLKSSLELYAPLDGRRAAIPDSLANLAQSTNTLARLSGPALGLGGRPPKAWLPAYLHGLATGVPGSIRK